MNTYNIVLSRPIENGMSSYEVLQYQINKLEQAAKEKHAAHEEIMARIEQLKVRVDNWNVSRRERWTIEDNIASLQTMADRLFREYVQITDECRGIRKAVDVIIFISNYGGEVTQQNRRQLENILSV